MVLGLFDLGNKVSCFCFVFLSRFGLYFEVTLYGFFCAERDILAFAIVAFKAEFFAYALGQNQLLAIFAEVNYLCRDTGFVHKLSVYRYVGLDYIHVFLIRYDWFAICFAC
jgi:hypothetical protein